MALREQARQSATKSQNNSGSSGQSGDYDGIELTGEEEWVKVHPGTLLTGTLPDEDEGNPLLKLNAFDDEAAEINAEGNLGIVIDNPEVVIDEDEGTEGTVILETEDDDSSGYRIYNEDREGAELLDGVGVEFDAGQGARIYRGETVESLDVDRIVLTVSGGAVQNMAKRFDVNGGDNALYDYDEDQANNGLIEYPLTDDDGNSVDVEGNPVNFSWRYARAPELRPDLYGQEIAILMDWSSNMVDLDELDEDAREAFEARDDSYYYTPFNMSEGGEEITPRTGGEPERVTYLEWRYDPEGSGDRIPEDQFEFVTGYVDEADDFDEESIREAIESNADEFESEPEEDRIVEMIQERA